MFIKHCFCLAFLSISMFSGPVWASPDMTANPASDLAKDATTPKAAIPPPDTVKPSLTQGSKASLPKKALGLVVGAIVGTPVCVVRKTIDEEKYGINGMIGTSDKKSAQVAAGIFWAPFALFTGTVESPVYATIHSLNADEPFSKEQFSLGDVKPKSQAQN